MAAPRIAVLGSINMDLVVPCDRLPSAGETLFGNELQEMFGGKGANQAVAASRLGGTVDMIGRVGDDSFSDQLIGNLTSQGVSCENVQKTENCASGVAIVSVDSQGENSITVIPGSNDRVTVEDVLAAESTIRRADILLMQLEIPTDAVLMGLHLAREANTKVLLDPAPAPLHIDSELLKVDYLCPNETETATICGTDSVSGDTAGAALADLKRRGVVNPIITLGKRGAMFWRGDDPAHVPSPTVQAADTTAAGDTFAGALGVELASDTPLEDALRLACAAAAIATTKVGAQRAMPRRDDAQRLLDAQQPEVRAV